MLCILIHYLFFIDSPLCRFLPQLAHQALDTVLTDNNIHPRVEPSEDEVMDIEQALTCKQTIRLSFNCFKQ